ncbi:MAG: PLP-dependent aminotransferase family protein [Lachnospiraceae bacterium]|nr:PLP-dependent aminotransferase family protein [Lachnospiraceae bacterium]
MYELTVLLEENGKEPLYEQIYRHIREEIRQGKIEAGKKLPSTRRLAGHLGVSRSTTQLAYDQLIAEGYLTAVPCKGYFAAGVDSLYEIRSEEKKVIKPPETEDNCRYDFSARGIDADGFPANRWKKLAREVLSEVDGDLFAHGDSQGERGLREAIRDYVYSARGVNCRTEQILVGAGSEYLLMLLDQIIGGDTVIAMENPTYMQAYRVFKGLGNQVIPVPMDEQGMDMEKLRASEASLAYVMPSHQFPTGRIMPQKRRMELIAWAAAKDGRYIIEDDYDSEFRYRGKPIPSLQGYDHGEHVIYLGTFSRSIAPGIRVSFLILPEPLLVRYNERCRFYATTVSRIDQEILARFIRSGYYERHLNRMKGVYRAKHDLLLELLRPFQGRFRIRGEHAGIHILLEERSLPSGAAEGRTQTVRERELQLMAEAEQAGVRVYGSSRYYLEGEAKSATILLGFARMSTEEIREAVKRLGEAWGI